MGPLSGNRSCEPPCSFFDAVKGRLVNLVNILSKYTLTPFEKSILKHQEQKLKMAGVTHIMHKGGYYGHRFFIFSVMLKNEEKSIKTLIFFGNNL